MFINIGGESACISMLVSRTEIEWNVHTILQIEEDFFGYRIDQCLGLSEGSTVQSYSRGNSRLGKKRVMSSFKGLHCDPRPGKPPLNYQVNLCSARMTFQS